MKILLTGAGGFLGRGLAAALAGEGHEVIPVNRRARGLAGEVVGDLTDPALPARLPARVEAVVHAAAHVPERESAADLAVAMAGNAEATLRLLEYARGAGVRRFVHISSAAVYGVPAAPGAVSEEAEPRPDNAYALSKFAAELMLEPYHFVHGMGTVALRASYVYGPGMRETTVVRKFLALARGGAPIPLVNEGRDYFDLVHRSDVAAAACQALGRGQGIYNVGSGRPTTVRELAEAAIAVAGSRSPIELRPASASYHSKYLDISRAAAELGWRPRVSLRDGLTGL